MMKPDTNDYPDEIELHIDAMAQGGNGVGRWQGRVVFATGGLPGERVRVRLFQRKARYARGRVTEVLSASPERVPPRLPGADHMPWQHIAYEAQVGFKQAILREQLAKLARVVEPPVAPVLPAAQPWNYRNTAHMHVQPQQGVVGYYAVSSHILKDMPNDPLLLPALNDALAGLRALLAQRRWSLTAITLRGSAVYGDVAAVLAGGADMNELAALWQASVPGLAGVTTAARPDVTLCERLGDVVFVLAPTSFFQVHTAQAEVLLDVVRGLLQLQPHECLLDAYSGAGTFALPLARQVREVFAIEEAPGAVVDGRRSAHHNHITNVTFAAAPIEHAPPIDAPVDAAILDPPRRGCSPAALHRVVTLAPARIAYVSCQPGVLARDIALLFKHGYRLHTVQPVDMFPQTPHIECVALLVRQEMQQAR
jgi:23S rRNA (uracil1939-C5)-methyltransferase